jgi:hypothetical protein
MYCHVHVGDYQKAAACHDKLISATCDDSSKEGHTAAQALYIVSLAKQEKLKVA